MSLGIVAGQSAEVVGAFKDHGEGCVKKSIEDGGGMLMISKGWCTWDDRMSRIGLGLLKKPFTNKYVSEGYTGEKKI